MSLRSSITGNVSRGSPISDAAAEWLATLTDASCTESERQHFVEWLKLSNLHVNEFLRISALTQRLTRSKLWPRHEIDELIAQATSAQDVVSTLPDSARRSPLEGDPSVHKPRNERSRPASRFRLGWWITACVVPTVAMLAFLLVKLDPLGWASGTYATSIGELRSITLEDGSVVELNTSSKVRARFSPQLREVQLLSGEAVFKVAKNANRPFRVSAGSTQIVAVGTEFNVYARKSKTVITVIEGRVRVTDRPALSRVSGSAEALTDRNLELGIGEQAVIAPHRPISRVKLADSRQVMSWTERRLIFDDTPLLEAAEEFARYNPKYIRVDDPKLQALRVSGVFNATDPASLVEFVEAYGKVRVQAEADGWILEAAFPPNPVKEE